MCKNAKIVSKTAADEIADVKLEFTPLFEGTVCQQKITNFCLPSSNLCNSERTDCVLAEDGYSCVCKSGYIKSQSGTDFERVTDCISGLKNRSWI